MERKDVLTPQAHPDYLGARRWFVNELYHEFGVRSFYSRDDMLRVQVQDFGFIPPHDTNWVLWCENPTSNGIRWREMRDTILWLREQTNGVIVALIPTCLISKEMVESIAKENKNVFAFPHLPTLPYNYTYKPLEWEERANEIVAYAYNWLKGLDCVLQLQQTLPIRLVGYPGFLPMKAVMDLQVSRKMVIHCSKSDTAPRFLTSAFMFHQCVVLLFTFAHYFNTFSIFHKDLRFWDVVPICYDLYEMEKKCMELLQNSDLCYEIAARIYQWWNSLQEWWCWDILFDKWEEEFGSVIPLGCDVIPFHHTSENWFSVKMIEDDFPKGKWSARPVPLSYLDI